MYKRILVTGGAGFLGSHLCKKLLERGNEVICVDNFFSSSKDNIIPFLGNAKFELIRHDVTFPLYLEVDEIYNLACPASPVHYQHDPVQTIKTCVHGAINMLGLAKRVARGFIRLQPARCTETLKSIRRWNPTGGMSTLMASVHATMKASAALKPCFFPTGASTICPLR